MLYIATLSNFKTIIRTSHIVCLGDILQFVMGYKNAAA
jgi:hypothetical protein